MTPERWVLVGKIYHSALERSIIERDSFLADACCGNEFLRSEVQSLLAAEEQAGSFLQEDAVKRTLELPIAEPPSYAGRKLGHYELVSRLGSGGMGEVYRALDTKLRRDAAIKILPPAFARDRDRLRRFEQEAKAASGLNHPNIVTIYETGETGEGPFLAMELVQGESLRRMVDVRPPLEHVIQICQQVAQALKVAHAVNIVHRDVKPENLMMRPDGYVKVLDFGLARLLQPMAGVLAASAGQPARELSTVITAPGMVVGTVRYMSPEQAQGKHVTGASDIFSLGLVMYELATGQHPFRAGTEFGTLDAILSQSPLPPSRMNAAITADLEQLILRMLDKEAEARPSAAEVEQTLAEIASADKAATDWALLRNSKRIVGRKREHEQLTALWNSAVAGHGRMCCVSGEPGIGKTALVEDFLSGLVASGHSCMMARGHCSERLAGTQAYSPLLEALEGMQRAAGSVAETMRRVAPTWYSQVATNGQDNATADRPQTDRPRVDRPYSQERIERELTAFFGELSRRQAVVLLLEDLHWADLSTVDLLATLADRITSLRLLVLITYRPSDLLLAKHPFLKLKQDLQARGIAHEIKLDFLSREEVGEYIDLEFPQHRLPPELGKMIHAKTEGSPLFMTDLLRYLRDQQIIARESSRWVLGRSLPEIERDLPESTRAMIERVIDRLAEHDRGLLVAASVQGHEFDSAVIARALGLDDAGVEERLEVLERVHQFVVLVEEREFPTRALTLRYRFTHVLYQNALYATLGPARRVALSNAVATALLALYGEQSAMVASDLARLFEVGRNFLRAAECYLIAAKNASLIFAAREAAALARQGSSVIRSAPQTPERNEIEFSLQLELGNALLVSLGYGAPEVGELYGRAYDLCHHVDQPAQLLPILYGLWISHLIRGKIERALGFGNDFLKLAQRVQSPAVVAGERMVGCPLFYLGQLTQARPYFERAISLYDPAQHRSLAWLYGQEPGMTALSYSAWMLWLLGYPDQAAEHNRESLKLARAVEHALSRGHGLYFAGIHAYLCRDWGALGELADELVLFAEGRELAFWLPAGRILHGLMVTRQANGDAGIEEIRSGIESLTAVNTDLCLTMVYRLLADGYAQLGRLDEALAALQAGFSTTQRTREGFCEPELHRFRGELLLRQQDHGAEANAEESFLRAVDIARQQSAKSWELRASTSLSRLWVKQGKGAEALELLAPLCDWFTEGRDTADLKDARALVEELR